MLHNVGSTERGLWEYINYRTCRGAIAGGTVGAVTGAVIGFFVGAASVTFQDQPACYKGIGYMDAREINQKIDSLNDRGMTINETASFLVIKDIKSLSKSDITVEEFKACHKIYQNIQLEKARDCATLGAGVGMFVGGTLGATTAIVDIIAEKAKAVANSLYGRIKKTDEKTDDKSDPV